MLWMLRSGGSAGVHTAPTPGPTCRACLLAGCLLIFEAGCRRAALLVGGDAAAVLLFAGIGRGSHAELDGLAGVLATAWPFLAGAAAQCNNPPNS
jgi:Protein of unknown function (DUF3054)